MSRVVKITKAEKDSIIGKKYNETAYFNPVIDESGQWSISEKEVLATTNVNFLYLKERLLVNYVSINQATDLHDVFSSKNLNNDDCDNVINQLGNSITGNNLLRKDIRFRGIKPSEKSQEARKQLMGSGSILLYSK